ncbi:DNA-binding transcriptional regulator, GntR family [Alkalibacterium putridalgicola]|uniref:DNA-binding transcriptional regulator, GntR family n=1 Tax=Alkalibacterium putridalgicola TaxID=426703 RepID=A0A1H7U2F2_9LACT|nr:GntR family transcriptional regulator [Alkalibacterium putridalgicola]GEK89490.1 GntR family transcriptional regulator [Alkalibacterium putridalgicola]SEL91260.1 DNA-binding transcriptional regulator, GntR family [Alkalibacterium putridalgicola]
MMQNITLQDQTYEKLRDLIIKTELYPGQKISESSLMELLEVGRTPIRESLKQLKKQGLVYTFPQSGTYVSKIDMEQAIHSRFVRECIEKEVMVELSANMNKKAETRLQAILDKQKVEFEKGNISGYHDLDNEFHRTCYEIVGKGQIWSWIKEFSVHLDRFRWLHLKNITFDYNQILEEHKDILAAIKARKTEEVKYLVVNHIHFMVKSQTNIIDKYPEFFLEETVQPLNEADDAIL